MNLDYSNFSNEEIVENSFFASKKLTNDGFKSSNI